LVQAGCTLAAAAVVLAGGWREQLHYKRTRFLDGTSSDWVAFTPLWRWAASESNQRIGFAGLQMNYPLFGASLSNEVSPIGRHGANDTFAPINDCAGWTATINRMRWHVVVIGRPDFPDRDSRRGVRQSNWTRRAGGVPIFLLPVVGVTVYRVDRPLNAAGCGAPSAGRRARA
jgi:hypothetical protein